MGCTLKNDMPKLVKYLNDKNSIFISDIFELAGEIEDRLNRISRIFDKYTLHNIGHSMRVMDYMYDLIDDINKFNDFEITLMIYSALLHDIGMCIEEKEVESIIENNGNKSINFKSLVELNNGNKEAAIQEYVRREHGNRSYEIILEDYKDKFIIPETTRINYSEDLAVCCRSHNMDLSALDNDFSKTNVKGKYEYNLMYISILLRLGDILDIDERRTPYYLYKLMEPTGISDSEWKQHYIIYNEQKIIALNDREKKIVLTGECYEPKIYCKILQYMDWIDSEVLECRKVSGDLDKKYKLRLKYPINREIKTKGFSNLNLEMKVDYLAISNLLMGENIYGSTTIGLREVIQNSIDACRVRKEKYDKCKKVWEDEFESIIKIILSKETNEVIIKDNGIGMNLNIIKNYFLNIGRSYYASDEFMLQGLNSNSIGKFGIGFLSCFMLGDSVEVVTKHFEEGIIRRIFLNKNNKYVYFRNENDVNFDGTEVIFKYEEFMKHFNNDFEEVKKFIIRYFNAPFIKFEFYTDGSKEVLKGENKEIKSDYRVELFKYMNEIDGYIGFNFKKDKLKLKVHEVLKNKDIIFYYNGKELNVIDENFKINDYISDNKMYVAYVEIIDKEDKDKFDEYICVLDDLDDVFDNLNLPSLGIIIPKQLEKDFMEEFSDQIMSDKDIIIGDLKVNELCNIGHEKTYPVKIEYQVENLFLDHKSNRIIGFEPKFDYYNSRMLNETIYLRNVLLDFQEIKFKNIIDDIEIKNVHVNIQNKNLLSDLSRSYLNRESQQEFNYAISKIIYLYLIDELEDVDTSILKEFVEEFFAEKSKLIRKERN